MRFLFVSIFLTLTIHGFSQKSNLSFDKYNIGIFSGLSDFQQLDSIEKEQQKHKLDYLKELPDSSNLDSTEKNALDYVSSLFNDRARLFIRDLALDTSQSRPLKYFNATSQCLFSDDTLRISMGVGFFANMGALLLIHKDKYELVFFQDADHTKVFKQSLSDHEFKSVIDVATKEKKLTLTKKPEFKNNEIIVGHYEFSTLPFYEKEGEKLVKREYSITGTFQCTVKKF